MANIRAQHKIEFISPSITNYVISLIKSWHKKFDDYLMAEEYLSVINSFEKKYSTHGKKVNTILNSTVSLISQLNQLLKTDKGLFNSLNNYKSKNKRKWEEFEKISLEKNFHENSNKIVDEIFKDSDNILLEQAEIIKSEDE
ncbi:hypothetical protein [Mycoplasmopsis alligatoris]|uniref:Uncharacterized protein n=1 Tax=Mycoplasmopsis alligatoris A21JP2 TaxID=747682 RepID=D4XX23_9BACT|nr:hypothetical protein [Mycoplasmopsis alligatoris]EFF41103.1 hypothetical protein MALL_0052 [Mycoplasmopsis alligatoris A21JP2]